MRSKMILQYWKGHPLSSLFLIVQLIAILILTAAASSATATALQYYIPFSDYFKSQGMFLEVSNITIDHNTVCEDSKELKESLQQADVLSCYTFQARLKEKANVTFRAYDPDIIRRYQPELAKGSWLSTDSTENNILHAVVWGLPVDIGDTIEAVTMDDECVPVKVIGILDDNATIVGHTSGSREDQSDYMQMYTRFPYETLVGSVVLLNQAEILSAKHTYPSIVSLMSDMVLIKYNKGIDKLTAKRNDVLIDKYSNTLNGYYMADLNDQSLRNIRPTLYFFMPLLIAAFSLMCVSALCSNAIVMEEQLYSYAVFQLCGMTRKQCIMLHFCHIVLDVIVAEGAGIWIAKNMVAERSIMKTTLHYSSTELICCICVGIFYLLISFAQSYLTWNKQSVHSILIDQSEKGR